MKIAQLYVKGASSLGTPKSSAKIAGWKSALLWGNFDSTARTPQDEKKENMWRIYNGSHNPE